MTAGPTLIEARGVEKTFGSGGLAVHVLRGISAEVRAGELCLLFGPSGSGKTTLVSIMAGLLRPTMGAVRLCGAEVSSMREADAARLRRRALGFVFQTYNLFPALSARDNVAEVLALAGMRRVEALARADEALTLVGLGSRLRHRPGELSGGQKQRVAIARAIAGDPPLVVGDEVTAALDGESVVAVMKLLRAHVRPHTAVLLVTHDHRLEAYADRVLEIEEGRLSVDRAARREVA